MTPKELNRLLAEDIKAVLNYLLPSGKRQGREWCVGSIAGEAGGSLKVRLEGDKIGVWSDFATGDKGDLLDLWAATRYKTFVETLKEVKEYLHIEDMPEFPEKKYTLPKKPACTKPGNKMAQWWKDCGISNATVAKLKIGQKDNAIVFPYISPDGILELVKYRDMDQKKFWSNDEPIPCLFGWQAVDDDVRNIVICEGEKDCLTFWEQGIPALSVPRGAGVGEKQAWIEYEYDRLSRFDEIYLCMDDDEEGKLATVEILDRLGRHRCKVINSNYGGIKYKDPNEAHQDGVSLSGFLMTAVAVDPEELKWLIEFHDDIREELAPEHKDESGITLPWKKTHDDIRLRLGEVSVWGGINSHGKSVLISQVMVDGVAQGTRWCVASMEMPPRKIGAKVYRQVGGVSEPTSGYTEKIKSFLGNKVCLFTVYGRAKIDRIMSVFDYARKRYGVTHFVIDSLAKCGMDEDDYNGQKAFVDRLFEYAFQKNVHIHLVVHMKKGDTEEKAPGKFDVKGTGAITDMASNVFIVWRNKWKENTLQKKDAKLEKVEQARNAPDTFFYCVKQRETGAEPTFGLWFHGPSCQFIEHSGAEPKRYID